MIDSFSEIARFKEPKRMIELNKVIIFLENYTKQYETAPSDTNGLLHLLLANAEGLMSSPSEVLEPAMKKHIDFDAAYWDRVYHKGSHPQYSRQIEEQIKVIQEEFEDVIRSSTNGIPSAQQLDLYWEEIKGVVSNAEDALKSNPGTIINDIQL